MDYKHRNNVLWRWCLFTFAVSLVISLVLAWFKPWGWTVPSGHIWVIPQTTPMWLAWPIANTLFVLTYVWMKTSYLNLRPFWREHRLTSYLRAILHGFIVALFCQFYSLPTLIISSVILSLVLYFKLGEEFFNTHIVKPTEKVYDNYDDNIDDWVFEDIPPYGMISVFLFFYTIVVVYQLNHFVPAVPDNLEYFLAFIVMPSIYLAASICIIVAIIIIALLAIVLWICAQSVKGFFAEVLREVWLTTKFFAEVLGQALQWVMLGVGFSIVAIVWLVYATCVCAINTLRWLFPPKAATT